MGIFEFNTRGEKVFMKLFNICEGILRWQDESGADHFSKIYSSTKGCYIRFRGSLIYSDCFDEVDFFCFCDE